MNLKDTNSSFNSALLLKRYLASVCLAVALVVSGSTSAQTRELARHETAYNLTLRADSSIGKKSTQSFTEEVSEPGATWLRLFFEDVNLGANSTLTITSKLDGATQTLDAVTIKEWKNSSAYFNGSEVDVTLTVSTVDKGVGITISKLSVGELDPSVKSQCGSADNRGDSNDAAIGRIVPIGCTGWIITNGRLVTAGHCLNSNSQIIEFNVPKSNPNRTIVHPGPEDQYPMSNFVTNYVFGQPITDWGVFRAGANSITGLTPIQAQGKSFNVVQSSPGNTIRITGFGTDTGIDNQTQQTHQGPLASVDSNFVRYKTDTTGGNSGSPIIDEATGNAVGVHAYGGCQTNGNGSNFGERATIPSFWDAMGLGGGSGGVSGPVVRMIKRNASSFALDGNAGVFNGQNVHLWSASASNGNQQWIEVNQGNGFYSYVKRGTNHALDGNGGGSNGQNVHLWEYGSNNQNQHWRKVNLGGGYFRLEKRNAPGFSLDGRNGGGNGQNVHLWASNNNNQNQHWQFITVSSFAENTNDETVDAGWIETADDFSGIVEETAIFPNPVSDTFVIQVGNGFKEPIATFFSILGEKKNVINLIQGANTIKVSDLSLPKGVYLVKMQEDDKILTKKLTVN